MSELSRTSAQPGNRLAVVSNEFSDFATLEEIPFFDPDKSCTHA